MAGDGRGAGIDASDSNTTLEAWWDGVCGLYLEVVEIMHDLIVVHVQVVEAERVRAGRQRALLAAGEHRVAHYRGALHLRRATPCTTHHVLQPVTTYIIAEDRTKWRSTEEV